MFVKSRLEISCQSNIFFGLSLVVFNCCLVYNTFLITFPWEGAIISFTLLAIVKSWAYIRQSSGITQANFRQISAISWETLKHISGISQPYLRHISGISHWYLRHISWVSQAYLMGISGTFQAYLRHI